MLRRERGKLKKVVVCSPQKEYFKVDNFHKHNIKEIAKREIAINQHEKLRKTMERNGVEVINVQELKGYPNSVFTRDTSICTQDGFIKLRMGLQSRRGEEEWMSHILEDIGEIKVGEIVKPGTVEGGDIILSDTMAFIGISERTNRDGAMQISNILKNMNYEPIFINVPKGHLHLGGVMSLISQDMIIAVDTIESSRLVDFEVIRIPDKDFISGNVITLGNNRVIVEHENNIVKKILEDYGFKVIELNLSEFVKGSGGPSCLILPVERG